MKASVTDKVYYLGTCNTCTRIMKEVGTDGLMLQEIRETPVDSQQLEEMRKRTDSYESLFNRRSRQFAARELKGKELNEEDYRQLLLEEPTFLKRPVFLVGDRIFIGNGKANVEALKSELSRK